MRTFCVNKSHKDFRKLQSILNIHEDQLEDIIFQYYNKYNTLEFPTFSWIETFYFTPNNVVKNTAQIQLFNQQYQKLRVFNTKKEAQEYEEQVRIYFPNKESFVTKHRTDGKYEVTVGIPKFEASYKGKTLITLPFALNRLFWKTVSLDKNTLGDQIIDKLISVFEKTHNYPDIRIEKLSEVTVQNALGEEERFVPDALGGKDIILGMQYLKDLNLLPRTKAIQEIKNTIIHESLHYITSDVINKVEAHVGSEEEYAFYDEINRLYNIAKEHFGEKAKEVYGLNNLKEFVAESFGNRRFQKQLSEIKDPNSKKGILNSFISALSNFFEKHFGINIKESVLEGIVNTTSNYMDFIWEGKTNTESSPILFGKDTIIINNLSPESLIALNINTPKDLIDFLGSYTFELKKANGERTVSNLITQNRYMGSYWVKRRATRDIILDSDYSIEKIKEILAHFGLEGSINFEEPKKGVYKISINEPVFNEKLNIIKQEEEERQYHEAWLQRLKEQEEINENYKKEVLDHLWELDSELASLLEQGLITINEAISKYEDSTGLDFWRGNYDYISSKKEYVESLNTNDITSQLMHHLNTYEGIEVGNSTELSNYLQKNGYTSIQEAIETEKEHGVTIQTEALNITGNKFKNSLYRGQGYAPVIDAEGNLHLHTNYDSLSKLKTLSFDSTIEGAEHYGNRSARHPYIIEIDEDFLDTILPKEDYDRDKVNRGESFRYNEEFNEVRLSFKDELIIPKGKFNITQTNETLRLEDFDDIMSSIGWLQSLEERSEIEEYNGASELTGRIHENDLKSLGKALKNTLGTYKGYDVITILYDVLALQNDVPGSPIGPSNQYKEFINKGLIETEDLNGYTYYRPSKALIEHLTKKLGLRKTSKTSQSIFPQSPSTPSTPPTPFAHFAPSNDYGDLPFFRTPQGEIYGFVGKDNKIYLDEHIISPEHPIHEYTHLWDRVVAKRNPKLWKRGVELMKKTSLWEQYANDLNYGLKWKATEGMTAERFEELVASEVHARLVGKGGEELLTQLAKEKGSKNIIEKLKSWLLDVWRELKSTFSNWSQEDINKLTLEDFNNMTLRDFVNKVNLDTNSLQRSLNEEYYAEREDFNKQLGEENTRTDTEKALNNWFEWGKEHIKFDEDSHIYYIDGKPVDYSVTEYYESVYSKPKIKGDYSHSLAIGKTMDSFYRDYFKGEDVLSKDYPNLNQQRKKEALVDVRRLESYLDKEFHVDNTGKKKYKIITTEFPLAARINTPIGEQTIAGTMDMLVIDDEGNLHIFDFKAKTNTIDEWNNRRNYTAQLNLYRAILESIDPAFKGKVKSLSLIWLNTYYPGIRNANYTTFKNGSVIVSDGTNNNIPLSEYKHFMTPRLSEEEKTAIIKLDIKDDIQGVKPSNVIPLLQKQQKNNIPSSYEGSITPDANTIFVFGSNPKGIHGAGAAYTAKTQFGAIQGKGEGMQGNAYALPTKDLDKAKGTRWYRPGKKEETEVKEWYKNHSFSEVQNHPLNVERTMTPQQIIKGIQKLYEAARQNPDKQFKVSHYPFGKLSLNGYLGEEMLAMFKQVGEIPSNVVFNKEWTDHWNEVQSTQQQSLPGPETKINIYAGTNENADLSNFATRPFTFQGRDFTSVEQAFQIAKLEALKAQLVFFGSEPAKTAASKIDNLLEALKNSSTGAEAKKLGDTRITSRSQDVKDIIDIFFAKGGTWDKLSLKAMKMLIKASFEQKTEALQRLLDTGNATLTHLSAAQQKMTPEQLEEAKRNDKWIEEFPRLLMKVREELREQYQNNIQQVQETPTKLEKDLTGEKQVPSEQKQPVKEKQEAQSVVQNTPITLSKEAQEHLNRMKVLKKKIEALQRDKWGKTLFKKSELQRLSVSIANNVSQMISEIEKNPNLISDYFGLDRAQLSETPTREEIINRIGINNFYMAVCAKYFQNSTDFSKVKKASAIKANFEVLMLLSNPILSRNEGIKIGFDYTKEESEQIVNSFEDNEEANENNETTQEAWQNNVRTIAVEYTMLPRIRRLLSNLPLLKNGEQIKDEWGIPQTVGLREVIGTILNNVGGIAKNHEHMASLLTSYMQESKNTWLQPVIDILNDKTGKYETEQSLLFVDFCKNPISYSISGEGFVSHELSTKQDYARDQVKRAFDSKLWTIQNKTENTVNKEGLKDLKTLSLDKLKTKTGIKELYKTFGLYLSNLEAERIVALNQEELLNRNASLIVSTLEKAKGEFTPFDRNSDTGIASYLYNILQPYIKITQEGFTSTVFEDGKRYQQFVLPSFLSRFNSKVQNSSPEEFVSWLMSTYGISEWYKLSNTNIEEDQLGSVSDGWRNPILQLLATDESFRKQFAWTQNLGFRSNKLYTFMKTLSPNDCLRMQMDMFYASDNKEGDIIPAWYAVPLMANKPAAEFIKLNRYRGENYKTEILNLLAPMFIKEVYRIKLVRERKALLEKHPELEIQNFDERGDQFCNFEMFNDLSLEDTAIIEDFIAGKAEASELTALFNKVMTEKLDERAERESLIYYFNGIEGREFINFYWNNFWAKTAMEDLFLGDGAFYKNVVDKQKRAMQLHSSGKRANISATWNKESVTDGTHRTIILSSFKDIKSNVISNLKEVFAKKAEQYTGEERVAYEEYVKSIIKQYEEIDVTDGQSFTTLSAYRKKAIMFGQWGDVQEEVYNRLKNEEINLQDLKAVFQPLKSFQYSQINKDLTGKRQIASNVGTTLVPTQYKHAEYLLMIADALLKGKEENKENNYLKAIADVIEATHADNARDGIDTVLFESSVKEGGNAVINISSLIKANTPANEIKTYLNNLLQNYKDKESDNPYVHISSFEDYMIQQELPAHFKDHYQAFPSQARYLSITDLLSSFNGNEVLFKVGDKEYTVEELQKEWENTWSEEVDYGISKLIKDLGITDKNGNFNSKEERNIMLSKVLVEALLGSNKMNLETLQALMPDENGNFTMPIDDPVLATTIMPLLFSEIKSRVNKQTAAGGPVVQVTSFGASKKLNIRFKDKSGKLLLTRESWEKQKDKKDSTYEDYLRKNQAGIAYMEVYATVPSEEIFEKFRDKQGKIDIEAINRMNPRILEMIGVRIPTEGKLSMWPLKIVGFLPSECGEVIMLPEEITKITGSDFDSDKQYIIRRALSVVERTAENKKEKVINYILEQNKNYTREFVEKAYDEYMENPENYKDSEDVHWEVENALSKSHVKYAARAIGDHNKRRNHIFDMMMAVLQHESVADQLLTPQGFEQLKKLAAEINGVDDFSELQNDPTNMNDLATYMRYYELNKEGSTMLGIFASQKLAHAVLSMDNYFLNLTGQDRAPFKLGNKTYAQLIALDPMYNAEGVLIGEILGSCVGASADVAKDPVLAYLGINSDNINIFITGLRLGIPLKSIVKLLNTSVIKEVIRRHHSEEKSVYTLAQKELKKLMEENGIKKRTEEVFTSRDALDDSMCALNAFLTLYDCYETVNALSKKTRLNSTTDSSVVGPSYGATLYKDGLMTAPITGIYDKEGNLIDSDNFYQHHPMLDSLYQAFNIVKLIFKDTSLGDSLNKVLKMGIRETGLDIRVSEPMTTKFVKFYQSQLLFYQNIKDRNKGIDIRKVANGYYDTFAKDFQKIKESNKENKFIQAIEINEDGLYIPKLDDFNREEIEALRLSWEDLAIDEPDLAREIFEYNIVKGGLSYNPTTFGHLAGNTVRNLVPGYKEAFTDTPNNILNKIYDDFIVKYWMELRIPMWTAQIEADKTYKYIRFGDEKLYKINGKTGKYEAVNTRIPIYQKLSEYVEEALSESEQGTQYQDSLEKDEMTSDTETEQAQLALDALRPETRNTTYQKYMKELSRHIKLSEKEINKINEELDQYC